MDSLSPQLLAAVCGFLPPRDRLASRQFSSKFQCLPCDPPYIAMLTLQQDQNTFSFTVKFQRKQKELWQIEISKRTQKNDTVFAKSLENGGEKIIHKTKIRCNRPSYHKFVDIYMKFFVRDCYLRNIRLGNLNGNFLAKFRKTIHKYHKNLNWEIEKRKLEMHTKNRDLTHEELTFLTFCKNPHLLRFSPPKDFRPPADFWNIPAISGTKQLVLDFGGELGSNWWSEKTVDIDLGIDGNFIVNLVNERKDLFVSNTASKITSTFLVNYIDGCLKGNYGLFHLSLRHNIRTEELDDLVDYLTLSRGFVKHEKHEYIGQTEQKPKDGWYPDELIVEIYVNAIIILNDVGYHRGKISCRDENHPFSN